MRGWSWAPARTCFVKKLLGTTGVANRRPFHLSLISKFCQLFQTNSTLFFSFWRSYVMICDHVALSLMNEIGRFSKILTCSRVCDQGTKTDLNSEITVFAICRRIRKYEPPHGQPCPASRRSQSSADVNQTTSKGDAGFPQESSSIPGNGPGPWAVMVNAESGCSVNACPWHSGFPSPPRFLVQCLFIQASRRDETFDPLCRTGREGRDFPKRSVLAALFCH